MRGEWRVDGFLEVGILELGRIDKVFWMYFEFLGFCLDFFWIGSLFLEEGFYVVGRRG